MSSLLVAVEHETESFDSLTVKASHCDVQAARNIANEAHPILTQLRNIVFGGVWYNDKLASCACSDLTLYRVADEAYTSCQDHGVQAIGRLVRADPTYGKAARK